MHEILNNISSISWWFGVIFVGVLVSLGAGYLKPHTDKWLAKYSKSRKNKNDEERQKWDYAVSRLQLDENYRILFISRITHVHGRSTFIMLAGISMFLISIILSVISQIPSINPSVEPSKVAIFLSNFPEEKIVNIFIMLAALMGSILLILGINYSKGSEKLQQQLEESVEKIPKEKSYYDK